jgi:predicted TIM-barrel fold metal-dependent hydrolase
VITGPFVDAHIHLWDLNEPRLGDYSWLTAESDPLLGPLSDIQFPLWDAGRFGAETRHTAPAKVVHVQAASAPGDPVAETAWLSSQFAAAGLPAAIVARLDLRTEIGPDLARHMAASDLVRGVRDMTLFGQLDDPRLSASLPSLAAADLSWELACGWTDMAEARRLADLNPGLTIVLGHVGFPAERSPEYLAQWRSAVQQLAGAPNVHCKISGLGMGDHRWTAESWRPLVNFVLETFGPHRCLIGSNWPIDRLYASYDAVIEAQFALTESLSEDERHAVRYGNAVRLYRL